MARLGGDEFTILLTALKDSQDMVNISTFAEKQNGHYIINGQKVWSTSAHLADYALTLVRTSDSEPKKHKGLTYLIVDLKSK